MERTGTKKPQAGAAQKVANPFEAVIKANPELAAILSGAINGTKNDVLNQTVKTVLSAEKISEPCRILCVVTKARLTDSFTADEDGKIKEALPQWVNPTPQLLVTFSDANAPRYNTHFFNLEGYMSYDEIVEQLGNTQQKPEDLGITMGDKGYAIIKDASGNLVRIPSAEKTEQCLEIVSRFFTAIQLDGLSIADAVDNIIEAINNKQNPELVVHFGYGKEYVNKDGAAARSVEPKKFLAAGAATDEKPAATDEEETAEEIDEFEQA